MTRHSDQTLSGLLTGSHTLNGSGNSTSSFAAVDSAASITESDTINNLVLPAANATAKWPLSGSINTMFGPGGGSGVVTTTAGFTQTCTLDLANPRLLGPCH